MSGGIQLFRLFLAAMLAALLVYTAFVIARHGLDLLPIFFDDIAKGGWPGQFNFDFTIMLALSAFWTAWRNSFSPSGLALGVLAFGLGAAFLCSYLLYLIWKERGDAVSILLGAQRLKERGS